MSRLVAAELLKLRTKPSFWKLTGAALALLAAIHALNFALKDIKPGDDVALELSLTGVVGVLMAVVGVMAVAGEHRDGSIRATYLWTPRRTRVLVAKALAYGLAAALVGLVAALLTAAIVLPALAVQGIDPGIGDGRIVGILFGNVLTAVGFAEVGLALGALLRSQAAAITFFFAWALAVDPTLASAIDGYSQLSLGGAGDALGGTPESQANGGSAAGVGRRPRLRGLGGRAAGRSVLAHGAARCRMTPNGWRSSRRRPTARRASGWRLR